VTCYAGPSPALDLLNDCFRRGARRWRLYFDSIFWHPPDIKRTYKSGTHLLEAQHTEVTDSMFRRALLPSFSVEQELELVMGFVQTRLMFSESAGQDRRLIRGNVTEPSLHVKRIIQGRANLTTFLHRLIKTRKRPVMCLKIAVMILMCVTKGPFFHLE
jgi:hypothetical protein